MEFWNFVVWIFSDGQVPFSSIKNLREVAQHTLSGALCEIPSSFPTQMQLLMKECFKSPEQRITADNVCEILAPLSVVVDSSTLSHSHSHSEGESDEDVPHYQYISNIENEVESVQYGEYAHPEIKYL